MWSAATKALAGLGALLLLACQGAPAPSEGPPASEPESAAEASLANTTLELTVLDQSEDTLSVRLDFNRRSDKQGPRVAEILLRLSDNLRFVSA